jgi:hypothetical protein
MSFSALIKIFYQIIKNNQSLFHKSAENDPEGRSEYSSEDILAVV